MRVHRLHAADITAFSPRTQTQSADVVGLECRLAVYQGLGKSSPNIGGQNLSLAPVPRCLQEVMPILKVTGNTLLCAHFGCGKRISTRAKSVNSELALARRFRGPGPSRSKAYSKSNGVR